MTVVCTAALSIMGILFPHTIPDISRHFPYPDRSRCIASSPQPPFSMIIDTRYLNVSTCFRLCFFLSYSIFSWAFTVCPFLSNYCCQSTTLQCNSSSVYANIPMSNVCSNSQNYYFLTLSLNTPNTTTNMNGLNIDPTCKSTVLQNFAETPHSAFTLFDDPLYMYSTNLTVFLWDPFFIGLRLVTYLGTLSNDFCKSTKPHYIL